MEKFIHDLNDLPDSVRTGLRFGRLPFNKTVKTDY